MPPNLSDGQKTTFITQKLLSRFNPDNGWLALTELSSSSLADSKITRYCDVYAINLYSSSGMERIGIEVKVSKSDLRHEVDNFGKNDTWFKYTNKWYIAVPDMSIVDGVDLPDEWGIFTVKDKVRQVRPAPKRKALEDFSLAVTIMKKMLLHSKPDGEVSRLSALEFARGFKEGEKQAKEGAGVLDDFEKRQYELMKKNVEEFRVKTGLSLSSYADMGETVKIAKIVEMLVSKPQWGNLAGQIRDIRDSVKKIEEILKDADDRISQIVNSD